MRKPLPPIIGVILLLFGIPLLAYSGLEWRSASADLALYNSPQCPCADERVVLSRVLRGHGGKNAIPDRLLFARPGGESFPLVAWVPYNGDRFAHSAGEPVTVRIFENRITQISGAAGTVRTQLHPAYRLLNGRVGVFVGITFLGSGLLVLRRQRQPAYRR